VATPGTILLSAATQRLVQEGVQVESYGAMVVDGGADPVAVYAVREVMPQHAGVPGRGRRVLSRFVGRQRELALLHERLAHAAGGQGQVMGIVGEPGIGKSRLLNEFRQSLRGMAITYYAIQCFSYAIATSHPPMRDLLRQMCGLVDTDSYTAMTAKISWTLQEAGLDPEAGTPLLLQTLDVPEVMERLAWLSPQARRAQTLALLWQLSLHRSQQHPVILAVENLQWIDTTSEAWLTGLVERLASAAILLLVTYRPEYRLPWLAYSAVTHMTLPPLRPQESRAMVQAAVQTAPLPERLVQEILAKAGGNPFFLEELAWSIGDSDRQHAVRPIPDTIQTVLMARIDRLAPEDKHLLQVAAVIGTVVPLPLLQAIAERPEDTVQRSLARLQTAGFLHETRHYPRPEYAFKHILTHEVAYGSLPEERWRVLHRQVVHAIEQLDVDHLDEQVERLAYHAFRGEVWDKAVSYCRQTGAKAAERGALQDAAVAFEQALVALQHLPDHHATRQQAIDLRFDLRNVLHPLGEFARVLDHLRQAEALAEALGDQSRLGQIAGFMAWCLLPLGAPDGALASARRALAIANTLEDVPLQVAANIRLGEIYWTLSAYRQAAQMYRKNVETLHDALLWKRFGGAAVPAVLCRAFLAMCLAELGAFAEGQAYVAEALQLAETVKHSYSLALACVAVGHVALRQGDLPQAIGILERGLALSEAMHLAPTIRMCKARLGTVYALVGRLPKALSLLEQVLEQPGAMWHTNSYPHYAVWLGEGYVLAGRVAEARQLAQQALEVARALKQQGWQAYALRLLGDSARDREPPEVALATTFYRQAFGLAEALGMRPLQAHCHLSRATLYASIGQQEQAMTTLATAMAFYRDLDMTFWQQRVAMQLAQVSGSR
jgi:predicted ATPase